MKSSEISSQNLKLYLALIAILGGLSGLAIFIVVTDKDIQVAAKDFRRPSDHRHLEILEQAIADHIASTDAITLCNDPEKSLQNLKITAHVTLLPLNYETLTQDWSRRKKEARRRCLEESSEQRSKRACFVFDLDESQMSSAFLDSEQALVEVQVQLRDGRNKKSIPCNRLDDGELNNLHTLVYYSVYWLPQAEQSRTGRAQMRTHGLIQPLQPTLASIQSPEY